MDQPLDRRSATIRLAEEAGFALGPLTVDPPARAVWRAGHSEMLEPRAMQLLVCLARRAGTVVGREALIDACWGGRIVGDDAVNRVIAQLRRLSEGFGAGAFTIETIPRVGYRMTLPAPASAAVAGTAPEARSGPWPGTQAGTIGDPAVAPEAATAVAKVAATAVPRRGLLLAAAGTLAAAGAGAWRLWPRPDPLAPARLLLAGRPDRRKEAEALLHDRLALAPDDPDALGLLALAHACSATEDFNTRSQLRIDAGRAAARRALARDPGNADATVALAMIRPLFGNWRAYEAAVGAAAGRFPQHWLAQYSVGVVRYQTGRFTEALEPLARAVSLEPHSPSARFGLALVQWAMGDLSASDATQRKALRRFPFDPFLFQQRFDFLALTGRAAEARSLGALGHRERPLDANLPMAPGQAALALDALELGGVGRRQAAVDALVAARREGRIATLEAAPWVAALGAPDMALAMLPSYFFGQGPIGSENHDQPGPGALRHCYFLFLPPMAAVWPLAGFRELLVGIGLEAFWRDSRTTPDFRR